MLEVKEWSSILNTLEEKLSSAAVKTWFYKTEFIKNEAGSLEIIFPNSFALKRVSNNYLNHLKEVLEEHFQSQNLNLKLTVRKAEDRGLGPLFDEEKARPTNQSAPSRESWPPPTASLKTLAFGLSSYYTFDDFVVGPNNHLAYSVALAISQNPGSTYNPFFLYASTGLGKTHLIQATGNEIFRRLPQLKVVYSTGESFTNELLEAIQHRTQRKFREKFRNTDVLLIDDVQFVAGKEMTQEEFFHAFNDLYLANKQIILTSDRPPREIALLEERLRSRFAGGMIADIQMPDETVRAAILRNKRDRSGFNVGNEVIDFIAAEVKTNVREMEGAFLQIVSVAKTQGVEVGLELATQILSQNSLLLKKQKPTPKKVIEEVCRLFNISHQDLVGPRRTKELVLPRQACMFLLRTLGKLPLVAVGQVLGGRDHSTVIHGVDQIEKSLKENNNLAQKIDFLTLKICG